MSLMEQNRVELNIDKLVSSKKTDGQIKQNKAIENTPLLVLESIEEHKNRGFVATRFLLLPSSLCFFN